MLPGFTFPHREQRQRWPMKRQITAFCDAGGDAILIASDGPAILPSRCSAATLCSSCQPTFGSCRRMRSEEHTSELQSLMRNSYAVFCLKKKKNNSTTSTDT